MFTDADIKTVEKATRGQSTNRLWHLYRQGLITASRFYEVTHMRESTDPSRIVNDLLANKFGSSSGNLPPSLKWGIENEAVAVKLFKKKHRLNHIHFKFYDMGLVVDSQSNFLGATPDGIIDCNVCGKFLIEVKCPWSMRYYEPDTAATANKCINDKGTWYLDPHSKYYAQIQGQLAICKEKLCKLVIYTLRGIKVIDVPVDHEYWRKTKESLTNFYIRYLGPATIKNFKK